MTASGRRWRSWTWLSSTVSAADTTVRTPGHITAVWPTAGTRAVQPDSDGGHELGRRVLALRSAGMLPRSGSSARLPTDHCCPWGTVRDRCYGHAEGTARGYELGSGLAAVVTSSTGGRGPSRVTTCLVGRAAGLPQPVGGLPQLSRWLEWLPCRGAR